jgi:hypothetical protein
MDADFLIIGDLNSYDKEAPIDAILAGADDTLGTGDDYTDLLYKFIGEDAYSYVFDGQIGYLDHGLANTDLLPQVTGTTVWHINADEPDLIDYDMSFKGPNQDAIYAPDAYRSSDHDPVIIGLDLAEPTVERLEALVMRYYENGEITGRQTAHILLMHLKQARFLRDKGVVPGYQAQLQAFANQVEGFTPQFITPEASAVLVNEAWLLYDLAESSFDMRLLRPVVLERSSQ